MPTKPRAHRARAGKSQATGKAYIVELHGGGDTYVYLVDKATWDWIHDGGSPTDALVKAYAKENRTDAADATEDLAGMHADNDRAMAVSGVSIGGTYDSSAEAQREATARGLEVDGEYQGYFY